LNGFVPLLASFFTAAATSPFAASAALVPLDVVHVTPVGDHQLVVYAVCSPEHCWHTFHVRKIEWEQTGRAVCRRPVEELNGATDFIAESISPSDGRTDQVELKVVSSHGAFEPHVITLKVSGSCSYELGGEPEPAANNSSKPTPLRGAA
jgi:hypothetical protein